MLAWILKNGLSKTSFHNKNRFQLESTWEIIVIAGLDHITINTASLTITERFYIDVIGLELAPRPNLGVPGIWLKAPNSGQAILHILLDENPQPTSANGKVAVDHIAFHALGFSKIQQGILARNLPWWGNIIESFGLWQLMVFDPNGVLVELNFKADAEDCSAPVISDSQRISEHMAFDQGKYHYLVSLHENTLTEGTS
ncbi:MAG: catechol 2,3-dioxygenase-like lactoylglutathione lyase family enzyme [Gammaproteobacteria bacterium]|jgi:catechol 2,3-dioxygenase-like lactoylglutathione lyase family enzyme